MSATPSSSASAAPLDASLRQRLVDLVAIPSVSRDERALADFVEAALTRMGRGRVRRVGDNVVWDAPEGAGKPSLVLCGHLDTVPANDNLTPRIDGDRVYGLGASDLKAGLAVFLELIATCDPSSWAYDARFVFYTCEEIGYHDSGLEPLRAESDALDGLVGAVCVEPTDNAVEMGCVGNLHAEVTLPGKAAHSARPWFGHNAIHDLAPLLQRVSELGVRDVTYDGDPPLTFREVLGATRVSGGRAKNVVPDEAVVNLNFRFGPDRTLDEAQSFIHQLVDGAGRVEFTDLSPSGRVWRDTPWVAELAQHAGGVVRPKQAWTDVGRFSAWDVPAISCGPGIPEQAHQQGEYATVSNMRHSFELFRRFLQEPLREPAAG